ncbi:MAG: hypothetical protein ACKVOP_07670 [Sphingomonadaceae bacterium]
MTDFNWQEKRLAVLADSENGRASLRALAEQTGARVTAEMSNETALDLLDRGIVGDALLVDLDCDAGPPLDLLLDRIDALGHGKNFPLVINAGPDVLDVVVARMTAPQTALMSRATPGDWIAALAMLHASGPTVLRDVASDDSLRLQRLADEVSRIARTLADLATSEPSALAVRDAATGFRASSDWETARPEPIDAAEIRTIIRLRRLRDRYFPGDLFADPAWDMLLDLMAARIDGHRVAVSSLCIAAAVPPTTALRWIKTMTDNGLFVRVSDPDDGRRIFIDLADATMASMTAYLRAAKVNGDIPI